ncbi:HU domain-containing protein [Arcticibacter tournemirensis]|uniref:SPOR domain-containing protein n=1 Tax=Arcticibacter tournemirensis TaxID=699437 RepID=A0A4Q0MD54_9SPHI|nr:SPOR domain-containing protein [Arcticibacter tournemirensis]RXF70736.1 SPOR domain-containing protein [Arcticibacter tournemirensis]
MDIALYISELLKDHNEIGLPGIGTFYKKKISARYDRENGILYPPAEEIAFKAVESVNGELIRYVSFAKKISEASSRYFINKFTDSIRHSLETDGSANLSPIGTLHTAHGHLSMKPTLMPGEQFGLLPIKDPAFSIIQKRAAQPLPPVNEPILAAPAEADTPANPTNIWQAIGVIAILLLIAGSLTYVFYPQFFNLEADRPLSANKPQAPAAAPALVPDTTSQKDSIPATNAQSPKVTDSAGIKAPAAGKPVEVTPTYEVIGASLALRSEAETYLKVMHNRGVKARIIEDTRKPKFKISLGSYNTYEEANQEKRRIQKSFNPEAWIFTFKDKIKQ